MAGCHPGTSECPLELPGLSWGMAERPGGRTPGATQENKGMVNKSDGIVCKLEKFLYVNVYVVLELDYTGSYCSTV